MTEKGEQLTVKGEFVSPGFQPEMHVNATFVKNADATAVLSQVSETQNLLDYVMVFAIKGDVRCIYNRDETTFITINNQEHNLIAVPKGTKLAPYENTEAYEMVSINLSASFLSRYLPEAHPAFNRIKNAKITKPILFTERQLYITPEISVILNSIENSGHTGFCKRLFLESKVIELLVLQLSQFELSESSEQQSKLKKDDLDKMHEVKEILITNVNSQLSLRTLAHMVGTNEFNLKKNFKSAFGTTVYGYLNQYKMEKAKAMLVEGDSKISEVSVKMGYKHATHFTSAFKKYFGYLPTKIKMSFLLFDPEFCVLFFTA
ncbi:AraC family transcriptional regulator [Pedobacter nyackensis]|uniref:helix-turn-helix domain-containing protein n=1 Tax=Pedobacter nyackensis TaxID=475255 RepID=UPI00292F5B07|nr:AraC family transcriptional regulator [Pedobacter nyackensis]